MQCNALEILEPLSNVHLTTVQHIKVQRFLVQRNALGIRKPVSNLHCATGYSATIFSTVECIPDKGKTFPWPQCKRFQCSAILCNTKSNTMRGFSVTMWSRNHCAAVHCSSQCKMQSALFSELDCQTIENSRADAVKVVNPPPLNCVIFIKAEL